MNALKNDEFRKIQASFSQSKICIFKEFEGRINFFGGHPVVDLHNWISPDNAQAMAPAEREPEEKNADEWELLALMDKIQTIVDCTDI